MGNKKGQLTLFIIVAAIIIGAIILVIWLNRDAIMPGNLEISPSTFLKTCISGEIENSVSEISMQGGYSDPTGYIEYDGKRIKYLCYTSESYKTCLIQQPLIKEHFEKEVNDRVQTRATECIQSLKKEYEKRGYEVALGDAKGVFSFAPSSMQLSYSSPMTVKKGENSKSYNGFNIEMDSQMYELIMTAVSIIDYEATYGDSETTIYMQYYPNLRIDKFRLGEGSKIYTLKNVVTNESFRFAVRSLVWPPGYEIQ